MHAQLAIFDDFQVQAVTSVSSIYSNDRPVLARRKRGRLSPVWGMCLLLLVPLSFSQASLASEYRLDRLEHRRWTGADGGPSQIGALAQTRDGYLWLGTHDSLYRFDGQHFTPYIPPTGNPIGIVSALKAVDEGLWVGLRKGGIRFMSQTGMTAYLAGDGLPRGVVYSIAQDRSGTVWAAVNDGLARFDGKVWHRIGADWKFPGQHAYAVFVDRAGTLWAANEDHLFYLPAGAETFVDAGIAVDQASQITQAPDGAVWVAERYGGTLRRMVQQDSVTVTVVDGANGLLFDRTGALWVGTGGAGIRYVPASANDLSSVQQAPGMAETFTARDGLSADAVRSMFEDAEGNIWVGTSAGLDRFRPRPMVLADFPTNALNFALAAGPDGSVLAGTSNLPAMRLSRTGLVQLDLPAPIHSAITDPEGRVWMAGSHGIWRVRDDKVERVASLPTAGEPDSAVRAMTLDHTGNLWVSINRAGLFVLREGRWSRLAPPNADPSQSMPVTASTGPQGQLWFGYRNNLIVTYDDNGERHWGASDGLQVGHVTAMLHHGDQTWIGGQRGVARFDGERFQNLQLPDNGLFDNIYAIVATPSNVDRGDDGYDLWLHSKGGIFQLTAAELQRATTDPDHYIRYRSYDVMGGLANDPHQVLPLPTAVRSTDGRLLFSTSNGVIWIDPAQHALKHATPKPVIESFIVDGRRLSAHQLSRLGPQPRRVEIAYSALNLSGHPGLHFRYQLKGFETEWQDVGAARNAIYTELGPGTYRFRVQATNPDGVMSTEEASLQFSIRPVFYRTQLFMLLCGIALAGILWMLHRLKVRRSTERLRARLEERHLERERIARELHDTLLQGVHGLMLSFQAATDSLPHAHPARSKMENALDRADLVLVEARDRVNELRDMNGSALNLMAELTAFTNELQPQGITTFTLSSQGVAQPLHPLIGEESLCIAREAIMNAFQHADAQNVDIRIIHTRRAFQLIVSDNGKGIEDQYLPPNMRTGHWGVSGMLERARKIGGTLAIRAGLRGGTTVALTVPASSAYRYDRQRLGPWLRALFRS